ncbi:NAD(P)-binding domain superfamily [Arabidopsis suecica]|uniref:NAD(P)-binding domain superfamily n=1 Tax=Arabidopsis suecica TaxID=45249 RepID=A0A8T1ZIH4_ARASU|nr:NAD(P)-binding domain superfamily [Arabidopsis suecica]
MFTNCSSSTTSLQLRVGPTLLNHRSGIINLNRHNSVFFPGRSVRQLSLRTTASRSGHILSIRSSSDHAAMVFDEMAVALNIMDEIRVETSRMEKSISAVPGLAIILFGDSKSSKAYEVPGLMVGIKTLVVRLAEDSSEEEVLKYVSNFNDDPCVHGILVQSPLPSHMNDKNILNAVSVEKDVDGFHPLNIGLLAMRGREPFCVPRIPKGCIELLRWYNFEIKGKRAVVLGRSNTFGMPTALLLQREDATVTIIHSKTKNPEEITRQADIIISAVGQPNMVRGSWIKPGAVVINVGTSVVKDPSASYGFRMVGDICYEEVCKVASAITPDACGPSLLMAKAMLLSNTLTSAKRNHNFM